jgi:hypothetical protein
VLIGGSDGKPDIELSRKGGIEFVSWYKKDISENAMIKVNKVCFSDIPLKDKQTSTRQNLATLAYHLTKTSLSGKAVSQYIMYHVKRL